VTRIADTYRFRDTRGQNLGFLSPWGTAPKRGDFVFKTDMNHHAKFTPIGVTVAEIAVTRQIQRWTYFTTEHSVAFVDNQGRAVDVMALDCADQRFVALSTTQSYD